MKELQALFTIQMALDQKIMETHRMQEQSLIREKCMALTVEMAELANETRIFKYWSLKGPSPRAVILEEYVDCLHFLLSIGLEKNEKELQLKEGLLVESPHGEHGIFESFETMFYWIQRFSQSQEVEDYQNLFQHFMALGQALKFEWEDIEDAYLEKNRVNHERQEQGY